MRYSRLPGGPDRSPQLLKQRTVREYGERYGPRILVETGTYYGEMVSAMKNRFERIYSIECDSHLAERAVRRFARHPHIQILQGDSQRVLPQLLQSPHHPHLSSLPATHYC